KNLNIFESFVFYLEVALNSGGYVTIRRSVSSPTKISIIKHEQKHQDFTDLAVSEWDYPELPFERSKECLDALFDLSVIKRWDYRTALGYSLRGQDDYTDVFRLKDFIGKHIFWKPYIGHLLGFDSVNLIRNYELSDEIEKNKQKLSELIEKVGNFVGDEEEVLTDLLIIKQAEFDEFNEKINSFDFDNFDIKIVSDLVSNVENEISELNKERYYLNATIQRLKKSQANIDMKFNINEVEDLFKEAKLCFGGEIKKNFHDLVVFYQRITAERLSLAEEQIQTNLAELEDVNKRLQELNKERSKSLSYISCVSAFDKYRDLNKYLIDLTVEINALKQKLEVSREIGELKEVITDKQQEKNDIVKSIKINRDYVVKTPGNIYSNIKEMFKVFVKNVLDKNGLLTTEQNKEGHLEYWAGLVNNQGQQTSESDGHSYQKILCMGYDISVVSSYLDKNFIRFIYHDGGLETLDDRKKNNFLEFIDWYSNLMGFQYILTLIDTDLPPDYKFADDDIVKVLHDDGNDGLLFKMAPW
ncbi:DUF2326 domain-containing protein, partial [Salmonella enterica subsp. enterica serovar Newport]|nr:DUF2326 domain-containing protein [Salmonella enterica subsp. enterica serovar Newport]